MKIIQFKCDDNLSKYIDSMLFDSDTVVASMKCEYKEHIIDVDLMVRGYVNVYYKGERFRYPSDFPEELKEIIRQNPNGWNYINDDIEVDENNWFEYIYDDTFDGKTYSDGIMFEDDLSKYSVKEIETELIEICKYIVNG